MDRQSSSIALHVFFHTLLSVAFAAFVLFPVPSFAMVESERTVRTDAGWFVDMNRFAASAHSGFKCEDCHGTMRNDVRTHPNPADKAFLKTAAITAYDYSRCQKCHKISYERYMTGGHARARTGGKGSADGTGSVQPAPLYAAPTCGACHSSHYGLSGMSRIEIGQRMITACGRCHPAHTKSYLDNIHGRLAANLHETSSAFCTDCHGAHTVTSLKEPEAALAACRRCHAEAESEYANIVIHAGIDHLSASENPKAAAVRWIERFRLAALGIAVLSLIFFLGHSFLWILRELHEKLRKH